MASKQTKFVTPEEAAGAVRSGDWVDYGFGAGFPELVDRALAARKGQVKDVKVRGGLVIRPRIEIVEQDPERESFSYYSWHIGDYERKLQKRGLESSSRSALCAFCPWRSGIFPISTATGTSAATWRWSPCPGPTGRAIAAWASPTTPGGPFSKAPAR